MSKAETSCEYRSPSSTQSPAIHVVLRRVILIALVVSMIASPAIGKARAIVIAHRGASGYLPEHTREAASYAHAAGADFIEQDVVLARDGTLVVCHDIHIDAVTDVASRYPDRARADGRFYAIDFTWQELRGLQVRERVDPTTGVPDFPLRFPSAPDDGSSFRLCTLDEQIALIRGLNRSSGREVGIYVEFKDPAWHEKEGHDLGAALLATLSSHGIADAADPVFVQCFDPSALRRLREELGTRLRLIQLIADNSWGEFETDFDAMRTPAGLAAIARYAQGIGPHLSHIVRAGESGETPEITPLVVDARAAGLLVHPYTFRADALPSGFASFDQLLDVFIHQVQVDGLFTDHPDRIARYLATQAPE